MLNNNKNTRTCSIKCKNSFKILKILNDTKNTGYTFNILNKSNNTLKIQENNKVLKILKIQKY